MSKEEQELYEKGQIIWEEYALEDDDKLTIGAQNIKEALLQVGMFKEKQTAKAIFDRFKEMIGELQLQCPIQKDFDNHEAQDCWCKPLEILYDNVSKEEKKWCDKK